MKTTASLLGRHLDSKIHEPAWGKRQIDEWKICPGETENHWWDDLFGCAVLASMRGCKVTTAVSKNLNATPPLQISFGDWPAIA